MIANACGWKRISLGLVFGIVLASCGKDEPVGSGVPEQNTSVAIEPGEKMDEAKGRIHKISCRMAPAVSTILPDYEEITGMKVIVSDWINDQVALTVDSPLWMTREEMIEFYHKCFRNQGFEMRPVDEMTLYFARIEDGAGEEGEAAAPRRPRRMVISPVSDLPQSSRASSGEELESFGAMFIQAPVVESLLPGYGELVGKKVIADESIGEGATMTINSRKKMLREEAIKFYEDSFKLNGYRIEKIDENTLKISNPGE